MNDPKKPGEEPQRVSQPDEMPGQTPPMQAPARPAEYEKNVPHEPGQPIAHTGTVGEGSYEGTRKYREGYEKFSRQTSPDEARRKAEQINPDDPSLKQAEQRGKDAARISAPSIH
jgi:hypothetical protein